MKYTDITQTDDVNDSIRILKAQYTAGKKEELLELCKKQYQTDLHDTLDKAKRPDKPIVDNGETKRIEKVNRLAFPLQKRIVGSTVAFTFGNPVKLHGETSSTTQEQVFTAIKRIHTDNKIDSFNRLVARELARSTETAEVWFPVLVESHDTYGFSTTFKLRVQHFSPWKGDLLYPYFDASGDLIAFSREFVMLDLNGKAVRYFEVYTDEEKVVWQMDGTNTGWSDVSREAIAIKKIPVVYGRQEHTDWHDVQVSIERLEYLLSNFADTNDYHSSPKIFIQGEIKGFAKKGESGAILQGENGATAEYLELDHAPESIRLEIETLLRFIYSFTQTPDISFDSVKGLQAISGEALKMLFLDAHLKVQDKREVFDAYLQRRINVIKAYVGVFNVSLKADAQRLQVTPEIVPYMINDLKSIIDNLTAATGGQPILSQKTAVAQSGLVENPDEEYTLIQEEEQRKATQNVFGN